jgi:hypothetical protein
MDFGSKYVYKYAHSEEESVSDDDDNALENDADHLFIPQIKDKKDQQQQKQVVSVTGESSAVNPKRKRLRRPDTNVLSVKFNRLLQPGNLKVLIIKI